ncbi:MAG: hypothetical protein HYX29_02415 [Solirubrobacterales bacterium]|nr:hypothetical protein [Solirubrobacterales bacterium]
MVIAPAGANAAFGVNGFTYTNSTLQANGHPNTTVSFNRSGSESEDLKDIQLDLPNGVFANPEAATTKCTIAQFNADTCPSVSKVGTMSTTVKALSLLDLTIPGTINVIAPQPGQIASLGLTLRPAKLCILFVFCAQPNKIFLKTGITINTFDDSNLRTYTPGSPKSSVIGIPLIFVTPTITGDITINQLSLSFQARAGTSSTAPYFFRQAGACVPATASLKAISYQGAEATASSTYTPTGCASVPSTLTAFSFTPSIQTYAAPSPVSFVLNIPETDATIQHALPKVVDNDFPVGSGINLEALAGVTSCSEANLRAKTCPASSIIGNATALSKYIPEGLTGPVYATGDVGNQVPIAVFLSGPRESAVIFRGTLGVRGDTAAGTGRAYARFDRIPQLPFSKFTLNLTKPVYVNPPTCGAKTTTATIDQFSGQTITRTNSYNETGCPTAPNTTITAGPPSTTTDATPTFTFTSDIAGSTFQCSVDGGAYQLCTSPFTAASQTNGPHNFKVYAVNNTVPDATPASYDYTVNVSSAFTITPTITPSTTQAGANPNLATTFNLSGGQPKTLQFKLPAGFNASLAAVTNCPTSTALAGNCTSASLVGTSQLTVDTFSGSQTGVGEIYLTDGPTAADAGGVAVKITMPFGTFIAQAGAYLVNNGANQYLDIRDFPTEINGTAFTITQLKMDFSGANGFLTNPSQCVADSFNSTGTAFDGSIAAVQSVPFQATNCAALAFNPTVTQTFSSPVAGTTSNVVADIDLPAGNSSIKNMTVLEPPVFGPNYPAFGRAADMCPGSAAGSGIAFNPANCPAQSKVGAMTLNTPLLTTPLVGDVYLINKTPLPWFGVKFDQPGISVRLTGVTDLPQVDPTCNQATDPNGFCQSQISVRFNAVPDVPITHVKFALNGGPRTRPAPLAPLEGELLQVSEPGDTTCQASSPAKSIIDSYSGLTVNRTQNRAITGC